MLEPTFAAFPQDPATKDAAGVPFGCEYERESINR